MNHSVPSAFCCVIFSACCFYVQFGLDEPITVDDILHQVAVKAARIEESEKISHDRFACPVNALDFIVTEKCFGGSSVEVEGASLEETLIQQVLEERSEMQSVTMTIINGHRLNTTQSSDDTLEEESFDSVNVSNFYFKKQDMSTLNF